MTTHLQQPEKPAQAVGTDLGIQVRQVNGLWGWEKGQNGILTTREGMKRNGHQVL